MKLEFPYKENDIITIFADWEEETTPIGTAKLVEFHKLGRSFILEDTYPESEQIVYNYQEWIVEWADKSKTFEFIRFVDTIGISNSTDDDVDEYAWEKPLKDSFIIIKNKECF